MLSRRIAKKHLLNCGCNGQREKLHWLRSNNFLCCSEKFGYCRVLQGLNIGHSVGILLLSLFTISHGISNLPFFGFWSWLFLNFFFVQCRNFFFQMATAGLEKQLKPTDSVDGVYDIFYLLLLPPVYVHRFTLHQPQLSQINGK